MDCDSGGSVMPDPVYIAQLHRLELIVVCGSVLVVALLAFGIAAVVSRRWPHRTLAQLTTVTVFTLALLFFALTVGTVLWLLSTPCPEGSVCDAGAMAAAGAIAFGSILLTAVILVGAPVAYFTARRFRRK